MELFTNNATANLSAAISNSATSLTVTSAAGFPSTGNFRIIVDSEIMLVTGVSGTTLTVTRGSESTAAASHSLGAVVSHVLTSGALSAFRSDNISTGTLANLPTVGTAGRIYLPTDAGSGVFYHDNGSAWVPHGPLQQWSTPPSVSTFGTTYNSTSGTLATGNLSYGFYIQVTGQSGSGENLKAICKNIPNVSNYTVTMAYTPMFQMQGYCGVGITITDGTKFINTGVNFNFSSSGGSAYDSRRMTNATTYSSDLLNDLNLGGVCFGPVWQRISCNGTTRTYWGSPDGVNWIQFAHDAANNFLTETQYGIYIWDVTTAQPIRAHIVSWLEQ